MVNVQGKTRFWSIVVLPLLCLASLLFSGCISSMHHFNKGRTLESGKSRFTYGYSRWIAYSCGDSWDESTGKNTVNSAGKRICPKSTSNGQKNWSRDKYPLFSRDFRLGVRDKWGPFPGVELGYHYEIPTSLEFDGKLALPGSTRDGWAHSLSLGWGIGTWVDNTIYAEYATSLNWKTLSPYANYRLGWMATSAANVEKQIDIGDAMDRQYRSWEHQASFGLEVRLPDIPVIPDYLHVLNSWTFPYPVFPGDIAAPAGTSGLALQSWVFGIGWEYK